MRILAGTGHSGLPDALEAGREAARGAMASLDGEQPALVMVFTKPGYDLAGLLGGVRSVTGGARLIGATASGEIAAGTYLGAGVGVAVMAMTAGPYRFGFASAGHIHGGLNEAGQDIARRSRAEAGEGSHGTLVLLADMLLGDLQQLVLGAYRVTGPRVPVVGGAAGDEQRFKASFVFLDDQIVPEGAVGMWISSDKPLTVRNGHGWEPLSLPMLVTAAEGTILKELGGRPAAEVYIEQLGLDPGSLDPDTFWATSIRHPFGLLQSDGETIIRVARSRTEEGYLKIQGCLPPVGSAVQIMHGDSDMLLKVVPDLVRNALSATPEAGVLLAFSCAARAAIYRERTPEEPRLIQDAAGSVPTFGFYCCGEFARTRGVLGTHNATVTVVAL